MKALYYYRTHCSLNEEIYKTVVLHSIKVAKDTLHTPSECIFTFLTHIYKKIKNNRLVLWLENATSVPISDDTDIIP